MLNLQRFKEQATILFLASFLLLLPFKRLVEIPVALMAIGGIIILLGYRNKLSNNAIILFSLVFFAFWLPIVISLWGAVNPERTLTVTAAFLRLYLAGIFIISILLPANTQEKVLRIFAWILLLWTTDALFQTVTGHNIFGYNGPSGRVNSFFGELRPDLGVHLATLSPLLMLYAHRHWPVAVRLILPPAITLIVFLAGSRNGWIMIGVVLAILAVGAIRQNLKTGAKWVPLIFLFSITCLAGAYYTSKPFAAKVNTSLKAFEGDVASINQAASNRVPIWETAVAMFSGNHLNGVGARGFRYAYKDYAVSETDPFVKTDGSLGALHPHQLMLEIGAETGGIGLAGYLLGMGLLLRAWVTAGEAQRTRAAPYALALLVAFLPINSYYALYSSAWSVVLFWLISIYCAAITTTANEIVKSAQEKDFSPLERG